MRKYGLFTALFVAMMALVSSAHAATISLDVSFSATNFLGGGTAPVDPVQGSFRLTFDPTQTYFNNTTAVSNFTINLTKFTDTLAFSYTPFLGSGVIGGLTNGALGVTKGTNDFNLGFTLAGLITEFTFSDDVKDSNGKFHKYTALFPSLTVSAVAPAPIPGSVLMLLTALGGLGGTAYIRRRKLRPQTAALAAG